MTNRIAYRYLICAAILIVPYQLLLDFGPSAHTEFRGLWEVWHPYFVPAIGILVLPIILGYNLPLVKQLGGTKTALGRVIFFMTLGMTSYTILGAMTIFGYITCAKWPLWQCDNPLGWIPYPSLAHFWFALMYPFLILAELSLFAVLGMRLKELVKSWWLLICVLIIQLSIALPFGFGNSIETATLTSGHALDAFVIVSGSIVLWLALVAAQNARNLSGGMFYRPLTVLLLGLFCIAIGDHISTHNSVAGKHFTAADPASAPYTAGFVLWSASFLMIGGRIERLLGGGAKDD